MLQQNLVESSAPFLAYLEKWYNGLEPVSLESVIGGDPARVAIFCVDVIVGFCDEGNLASSRVDGIVEPIVRLFKAAHDQGIRNFVLPQDTHHPEAIEFGQYARHCVQGTRESQTVPELASLPFASSYTILPKNSIAASIGTELGDWMREHPEVETCIVVGDCSDLCTYQLGMHLRLYANAHQLRRRIILPENCVQTYDLSIDAASQLGAFPHPGDFYHVVFLHHMAQNGLEVVRELH